MTRTNPVSLIALMLLLAPVLTQEAQASPPKPVCLNSVCRASCDSYCAARGSVCGSLDVTDCSELSCGVSGQCNFTCVAGGGLRSICYCPDCPPPGGSPIFKKQPTARAAGTKCETAARSEPKPSPAPKAGSCP